MNVTDFSLPASLRNNTQEINFLKTAVASRTCHLLLEFKRIIVFIYIYNMYLLHVYYVQGIVSWINIMINNIYSVFNHMRYSSIMPFTISFWNKNGSTF